jgi:hypothetical protein
MCPMNIEHIPKPAVIGLLSIQYTSCFGCAHYHSTPHYQCGEPTAASWYINFHNSIKTH